MRKLFRYPCIFLAFLFLISMAVGCTLKESSTPDKPSFVSTPTRSSPTATQTTTLQPTNPTLAPIGIDKFPHSLPIPTQTTPVPSPTPTNTPYPSAPPPKAGARYHLQTPDPQRLLSLFITNWKRYEGFYHKSGDPALRSIQLFDVTSIDDFVIEDIDRYYPENFPASDQLINHPEPEWQGLYYYPSDHVENLLLRSILQYFNDHHIQFTAGEKQAYPVVTVLPYSLNLDRDSQLEWLIELDFTEYAITTWLPLDIGADGIYTEIPNDLPVEFTEPAVSNGTTELILNHDLNGDGIAEILISYMSYLAGGAYGQVSIYAWKENRITEVGSADLPGVTPRFGEVYQSTYEVKDTNGDGREELIVRWPRFRPFGCTWDTVYTYRWNGIELAETAKNDTIPKTPDCEIARALESHDPQEQAKLYERVLTRVETKKESADKEAWVRLQLAVTYAGQNRDTLAAKMLRSIVDIDGNGGFVNAIRQVANVDGASTQEVCRTIYDQAKTLGDSGFASDIDADLSFNNYYPIYWNPVPEIVCPYWDLVKYRLKTKPIPGESDPVEALQSAGYAFTFPQRINLDDDIEMEWIGVIKVEQPLLVVLDYQNANWHIYPVDFIEQAPQEIEATVKASPDRAGKQILILVNDGESRINDAEVDCRNIAIDYQLLLAGGPESEYQLLERRSMSCQLEPPVDLTNEDGRAKFITLINECSNCDLVSDWDIQAEVPSPPAWVTLQGYPVYLQDDQDIFDYAALQKQRVIAQTDLDATRSEILRLLEYLPGNDSSADLMQGYLRFLLGFSYELKGENEKAVAAYLELIQTAPNTPWSWLAWTRLGTDS
jgi:hypothetical protein